MINFYLTLVVLLNHVSGSDPKPIDDPKAVMDAYTKLLHSLVQFSPEMRLTADSVDEGF